MSTITPSTNKPVRSLLEKYRGPVTVSLGALSVGVYATVYGWITGQSACPTHSLFGIICPGCGGIRAVKNLFQGKFSEAFSSNALGLMLVFVFVWLMVRWVYRLRRDSSAPIMLFTKIKIQVFVVLGLAWTIFRWLPIGESFTPG